MHRPSTSDIAMNIHRQHALPIPKAIIPQGRLNGMQKWSLGDEDQRSDAWNDGARYEYKNFQD